MKRNGVTLLEVVFGIAIAAIGILGVMGTLVVAGKQASDGARMDAADRLGRNAIREFDARGFNRPVGPQGTWAAVPVDGQSYCLDPLYVAANGTVSPACWFPAIDPVAVPGARMHRVSARAFPGNQLFAPLPPIGLPLAESVFTAKDDLVFSLPGDRTLPPVQHYGAGAGARSFDGAFSWFATVSSPSYVSGLATVHIVVCHRRVLNNPDSERLVNVEQLDGNQFKFAVRSGQADSDLDTREGGWLLLIGNTNGMAEFRWHQIQTVKDVISAGSVDYDGTASTVSTRWVSTFGRDWSHVAANTQVCLLDSVVAVYEKQLRLSTIPITPFPGPF